MSLWYVGQGVAIRFPRALWRCSLVALVEEQQSIIQGYADCFRPARYSLAFTQSLREEGGKRGTAVYFCLLENS